MAVHSMVELLAKKDKKVKKPWPWPDNYTLKLEELITGIINKESVVPYSGGESHTDSSGLITKMGIVTVSAISGTVTFGTAFPTAIISLVTTLREDSGTTGRTTVVANPSTTAFSWGISASTADFLYWVAIGH